MRANYSSLFFFAIKTCHIMKNKLKEMFNMTIKEVRNIREEYREMALDKVSPNRKIRDIWNASVMALSCYDLFMSNPIANIKYGFRYIKSRRRLERLMGV